CYYRRLALTEQTVQTTPLSSPQYLLVEETLRRRRQGYASQIPIDFSEGPPLNQCQIPNQEIINFVLPSYVRYIADRNKKFGSKAGEPERPIDFIRVYRVTHMITAPDQFAGIGDTPGIDLMDPTTYKPYYQGKFNS